MSASSNEEMESWKRQRDELQKELESYKDGSRDGAQVGIGSGNDRQDITPNRVAKIKEEIAGLERLIAKG